MLLEELANKEKLNVDFHNHLQTGHALRKKPKNFGEWFKNLFLEEGFSSLTGILDRVKKSKLDIIYITNFGDETRYEDWTSTEQIREAIQAGYEIQQGQYYLFAKKDGKVIGLGKSQEVPTTQGHALFAGLRRDKKLTSRRALDETVAEAYDRELKIADHTAARLKGQNGVLAYSKNREADAKKFDVFEENGNFSPVSMPFSIANYLTKKWGRRYNKPVIRDSDGHHPRDIGKTYNILDSKDLDYSSERAFRDSINDNIRKGNFKYKFRPIPPWRVFHHVLMLGMNKIYQKIEKIRDSYIRPMMGI